MNRGLKSYGIMLIMITTLIFTLNFGVVNATSSFSSTSSSPATSSSINPNNSTQANPLTGLNSDSNDVSTCEDCVSNNDNSNSNDDNNNNKDNDGDSRSSGNDEDGDGDVPMSLPFNSNLADESDDEKDYSNAIPFP
jgi:hypothetical protein